MIAWDRDGTSFAFVHDGVILREDGAVVARDPRRPDGVVRLDGCICAVHVEEDRCRLVDIATSREVLSVEVTGRVVDVRVLVVEGNEVIATVACAAPRVGLDEHRAEHAWFDRDGTRRRRCFHRAPKAEELPLGVATLVPDGLYLDGRIMHWRGQNTTLPSALLPGTVVAAAGDSWRIFLADAQGLVFAFGRHDTLLWSAALREAGPFERLHVSGDGRLLLASARDVVAAFNLDSGTLVGTARLPGPGILHPAPTGRAAVWLGSTATRIALAGPPAAAVPVAHRSRTRKYEHVVEDDVNGALTALVRGLVAAQVRGHDLVAGTPPFVLGAVTLEQTAEGAPRTLLEPWRVTHDAHIEWVEGWDREAQLLAAHTRGWLGPFASASEVAWRFGFVRRMRVERIDGRRWRELLALPTLRFLEELTVGELLASTIPKLGFPRCLASLSVSGFVSWSDDVFAKIPWSALRHLSIRALPTQILAVAEHLRGLASLRLLYPPSPDLRQRIVAALPGVRVEDA